MSAPLSMNTKDGTCWTRRAATRGGLALYAPEGVCSCPEFVMATEAELAELGIAGSADVLPMPVGPEASRAERRERAELLAAYERALAPFCADSGAAARAVAEVRDPEARWLLRDAQRLQDRVIVLEAERCSTNEALDDAVQELRADRPAEESSAGGCPPALSWLALLDEDDRVEFLDELADSATVNASSEVRLAEVERTCATWRLIAEAQHGHNTAPGPDAVTQVFAPVASLREGAPLKGRARLDASAAVAAEATHWKRLGIEDPHDSPLHQSHRVPHDLPVPDGCRLGADDLDEISRDVWFGGGA